MRRQPAPGQRVGLPIIGSALPMSGEKLPQCFPVVRNELLDLQGVRLCLSACFRQKPLREHRCHSRFQPCESKTQRFVRQYRKYLHESVTHRRGQCSQKFCRMEEPRRVTLKALDGELSLMPGQRPGSPSDQRRIVVSSAGLL